MSKEVLSVSLDGDVVDQLKSRENLNNSAVANELLRQYLAHGEAADAGLQMRLKDIDRKIQSKQDERSRMENEIDRLKREREDVQRQIDQRRREGLDEVETVVEMIEAGSFDPDNLTPGNAAIENYAAKASMTPDRFIDRVEDRL